MRVLVLGGMGMLGHKVVQICRDRYETWATCRGWRRESSRLGLLNDAHLLRGVEAGNMDSVLRAFAQCRPGIVVNCLGIVKQREQSADSLVSITINALFPHRVADLCRATGAKMIQISTDCVFSGKKGSYTEDDVPDPEDLYGRTKLLGEVTLPGCLTLRTSIVGTSLQQPGLGLIDWLAGQTGKKVKGFDRVIYSGLTTLELSNVIADTIERHPSLEGILHVSSNPITKYALLGLVNEAMGLGVTIQKSETPVCDRSLDGTRFSKATGYRAPNWPDMIASMATDCRDQSAAFSHQG